MKRYKSAIIICLFLMLLLPAFVMGFSRQKEAAYAFDIVNFFQAECLDFDGNIVAYDTENPVYARGIEVTFDVSSEYFVIIVVKNGEEISRSEPTQTQSGKARYSLTINGELIIKCYASDSLGALQPVYAEVTVRSDNAAPQEASVSQMTEWTRHQNGFLVQVVLSADNGNSGVKKAEIAVDDGEEVITRVIESPILNDSFSIYKPSDVHITVYDYAGNYFTKQYLFDKFDSTPPTPAEFVFTPNIEPGEATKGYVRDYFVTINYGTDSESGIKPNSMRYSLNGQLYTYEGGFYVSEQRINILSAYYFDNAGNASAVVSASVDNIDRMVPYVSDIELDIDLTKEKPYTLSMVCVDSNSGIDRVQVSGENYTFVLGMHNVYSASFDELDRALLQINVYDRVGNFYTSGLIVPHFDSLDLEDMAKEYNAIFLSLSQADYNGDAWQNILELYRDLNISFMSPATTLSDFDGLTREIDKAVLGATELKYIIASVPPGLNLNISYEINTADFPNLKKGDQITLVVDKIDKDGTELDAMLFRAVNAGGFDTAFANPFMLKFIYNGMEVEYDFANGAEVTLPVPAGYEERLFAVINLDTQEKLAAEVINNKISFTYKKAGRYALVTEGAQKSNIDPLPSGVRVFGKTIDWGAFFGTLAGVVALTAGLIALLTLRYKKPYMRRPKAPKDTSEE